MDKTRTITGDRTLSLADAVRLGMVLETAERGDKVRWLNGVGEVLEGTARNVVKSRDFAVFLGQGDDVRDAYLHITSATGFEHYLPVEHLMAALGRGEFAIDPRKV